VAASNGDRKRQADILRYWRAVEYFSPPQVDRVDQRKNVFAASARRPLPWESGSELGRPKRNCVWRHTVYAGIFEISSMRDVLLKAFRSPEKETDFDGRVSGQSALLSFAVDESGRLIKDSATLSSCGWAVGQTLSPGPGSEKWLTGFEAESTQLLAALLALGDDKVTVDRHPVPSTDPAESDPGSTLGPIAGVTARLVLSAATGGIGGLATAVGTGLGPIAGPIVTGVITQVGDDLATAAVNKVVKSLSRDSSMSAATPNGTTTDQTDVARPAAEPGTATEHEQPVEPPRAVGTKVLDIYDLAAVTRWVAEELGVAAALKPNQIRIKSYQVSAKHAAEAQGDEILNSFYAEDLGDIAEELLAGRIGGALAEYLRADRSLDALPRIDVRESPSVVLEHLQPAAMPSGRWPAESNEPLALSQQFAINRILESIGGTDAGRVYAVNGPPGTGKTTMLRDLIAALVVRRAEKLATLRKAGDAFKPRALTWKTEGKYQPELRPLHPELTGFEMVLASSNNGAVENVTLEVPGAKAVGKSWRQEADYLSGPASLALEAPAWGAIAARLGRRSNRSEFVERFWWSRDGRPDWQTAPAGENPHQGIGLDELLNRQIALVGPDRAKPAPVAIDPDDPSPEPVPPPRPLGAMSWPDAKANFKRARQQVLELATERQRICDLAARLEGPDAKLWKLRLAVGSAQELVDQIGTRRLDALDLLKSREGSHQTHSTGLAAARAAVNDAEERVTVGLRDVEQAESALRSWEAANRRPRFLRRVFSRTAERDWLTAQAPFIAARDFADGRFQLLDSSRTEAESAVRDAQRRVDHAGLAVRNAQTQVIEWSRQLSGAKALRAETAQQIESRRRELETESGELAFARERWGPSFPGDEWRAGPADHEAMELRERSAPWMDEEFARARTRLFLAALDLHRAVLANAPNVARKSLSAAMDVVKGKVPPDLPAETVLAAWQVLFLVVPVVSTTFASVGGMFSGLGPESLGWLLVDEAGQASPQAVVGALWRSRRAVVVGDPLQLEPVVTLPYTGQARLCEHFGVAPEWIPGKTSVQARADRLTRHGTWLPGANGQTWVGSPLRVHRRCDRMMFEVSNTIAYDGMMVYGARETPTDYPLANASVWINVPSLPQGEKWNPAEGNLVESSLDLIWDRIPRILEAEIDDPDTETPWANEVEAYEKEHRRRFGESVFVISPFREVVYGLKHNVKGIDRLPDKRVGTVHKTQGKEADVVILVLGTAAGQVQSRDWASTTPNLVNVAITRARRRLIVIGDHATWSKHRYFKDLAGHPLLTVKNGSAR
jgi:AAA domain